MGDFSKQRESHERYDSFGENQMARLGDIIDLFPGTLTVSGVSTLTGATTLIGATGIAGAVTCASSVSALTLAATTTLDVGTTLSVDAIGEYTSGAGVSIAGRLPSVTEVATTVLTSADSGKVFFINSDSGAADYTLPAPKAGLHFKWVVVEDCDTATTITTDNTTGDDFVGGLYVKGGDNDVSRFPEAAADDCKITLDNNVTHTAQGAGSWIHIYCGEDPDWIVTGVINANWEAAGTGEAIFSNI